MVRIDMETVAARLATFHLAHKPVAKGRSSTAKTRPVSWPYDRPSPEDLAQAGFYFSPTAISPDNAACFLCERALDGWEEDDDPIAEHLKHSSDCGWAIMMAIARSSADPDEIEDPTSDRIVEARRATFVSWPHDGKRGWICKTEKMVEAGWYFCPNEESEDFVSCAYCKLSLDGWEPKDDPFDEHYRRSPECSFFHFALSQNKPTKATRRKIGRSSKASRASTQSNATTISEYHLDLESQSDMDQSDLSQFAAKAATKSSKNSTKPKARGRKPKKGYPAEDSHVDIDITGHNDESELPEIDKKTRGTKRTSDQISGNAEQERDTDDLEQPEPTTKRRATKTRNSSTKVSTTSAFDYTELDSEDQASRTVKKGSKSGRKKRSVSRTRKASNASRGNLKSHIPNDAEIEAALEAELDGTDSDATGVDVGYLPRHVSDEDPTSSSRSGSKPRKVVEAEDDGRQSEHHEQSQAKRKASTSMKRTRGSSTKPTMVNHDSVLISSDADFEMDNSVFPASHPSKRLQAQVNNTVRNDVSLKAAKNTKKSGQDQRGKHFTEQPTFNDTGLSETGVQMSDWYAESNSQDDGTHEAQSTIRGVPRKGTSVVQEPKSGDGDPHESEFQFHTDAASPRPPAQEYTPSPSPQSSDAENRPPSTMPSAGRNALSPSKAQAARVTIAASTPTASPSKRRPQAGQLLTTEPWTPIDLDEVFLEDPEDKENVNLSGILHAVKGELTEAEKQMTVEEWIMWNAKNGEQKLRNECERIVNLFEREGSRAMRALEGIECCD
ncbi:hypothetical protein VTO42DRAFT_5818 [Malbranchea cinnamomea]